MDSDSSLDGEFETKHEIAVRSRRTTLDEAENANERSDEEGAGSASEKGESSPIRSPPLEDQGRLSPRSHDGEISESSDEDDAKSSVSSASSHKSVSSAKSVKSDKSHKSDKSAKSEKSDKSFKSDKSGKSDGSVKSEKSDASKKLSSPKSVRSDISVKSYKSDKSEKSNQSVRSYKTDKSDQSDKSAKSDKSDKSFKSDRSDRSSKSERSDASDRSRKSYKSDLSKPMSTVVLDDDSQDIDEVVVRKGRPRTPPELGEYDSISKKEEITGHGEDLSDVSDLDSNDGRESLDGASEEERIKKPEKKEPVMVRKEAEPVEEMEQLDFEAEEQGEKDEKEEGECEGKDDKSDDEGELKGEDLEEGEITDEDENRPEETEPRPICRFYNRGQCTWGSSCRFVHPGVTDKGNYTMFDMVRPLVPVNGPPVYAAMDYRTPYEKPVAVAATYPAGRKEETPVFESAWERGLRQAKELMRKSSKRKETDMDFEEKKMNLSLGQEELDKENDYYTRPASPILKDDAERWVLKDPEARYREGSVVVDHYEEVPETPYYHHQSRGSASDYWRRVHYEPGDRPIRAEAEYAGGRSERSSGKHQPPHRGPPPDYYDKYEKKSSRPKSHPAREVIVERVDKTWRDERYSEVAVPSHRGRGDEWADPWMRSKSPTGRKLGLRSSRRQSYSTGSSYTSSSSSRSSSQSSYSSYSRDSRSRSHSKSRSLSRSRSRSSSRTPLSRARRKSNRPLVPTARAVDSSPAPVSASPRKVTRPPGEPRVFGKNKPLTSTLIQSEKKAASERALLMNPPAPSPRKPKEVMRIPSPGMMRRSAQNPPAPGPPAARPKSKSSRSSTGSESSASSSESSESSFSSSSSSREPSPKAVRPAKRIVIDERERLALAQSLKVKAMDALKLSGQKQQIKLTLKAPGAAAPVAKRAVPGLPELPELNLVRRERAPVPVIAGKKRPAEIPAGEESAIASKVAALSKPAMKKATSRREELLKQLKAVEDAIARKRSKI